MPTACEVAAQPLTANCARIFAARDHLLLGISPFNSYFSRERIAEATGWAAREFAGRVQFHLPDTPSEFTLRALGMCEEKARKRAHENGLKMRNRIRDGLGAAGLGGVDERVIGWDRLEASPAFQALHGRVCALFDSHRGFRELCLETSRNVLRHRLPGDAEPTLAQCQLAARYFLAEIPLLLDTPAIVNCESSLYAYHRRIPFVDALFHGELPLRPSQAQGYLLPTLN